MISANRFRLFQFLEKFFPGTFANDHAKNRISREPFGHHLVMVMYSAEQRYTRLMSALVVVTTFVVSTFITALLLDIQYPTDNGKCDVHITEESCLARASVLNSDENMCRWEYGIDGEFDRCYWTKPEFSVRTLAIVFVCVAMITAPAYALLDILNYKLLLAPMPHEVNKELDENSLMKSFLTGINRRWDGIRNSIAVTFGVGNQTESSSTKRRNVQVFQTSSKMSSRNGKSKAKRSENSDDDNTDEDISSDGYESPEYDDVVPSGNNPRPINEDLEYGISRWYNIIIFRTFISITTNIFICIIIIRIFGSFSFRFTISTTHFTTCLKNLNISTFRATRFSLITNPKCYSNTITNTIPTTINTSQEAFHQ
jgi:hypothetical protein